MISALIYALVYLVVLGLVVWVILWALGQFAVPAPLHNIIRVAVIVIACLIAIGILLGLVGDGPTFSLRHD